MKELINNESDVIVVFDSRELLEAGRNYKEGDEIITKQYVSHFLYPFFEPDGYGGYTTVMRQLHIPKSTIIEMYNKIQEIESREPQNSIYSQLPY